MNIIRAALVYTALGLGAIAAPPAIAADTDQIAALRSGDMKKLVLHSSPKPVPDTPFDLADGAGTRTLAAYRGKYVLLNFWATWCAPCRKEMPQLDALQRDFGGARFEVLTIATGRNSAEGIRAFFDAAQITALPRHQDPKQTLARDMGVLGLPITVLIDPEGGEIARLRGDADWSSDSAKAIIERLIAP